MERPLTIEHINAARKQLDLLEYMLTPKRGWESYIQEHTRVDFSCATCGSVGTLVNFGSSGWFCPDHYPPTAPGTIQAVGIHNNAGARQRAEEMSRRWKQYLDTF